MPRRVKLVIKANIKEEPQLIIINNNNDNFIDVQKHYS